MLTAVTKPAADKNAAADAKETFPHAIAYSNVKDLGLEKRVTFHGYLDERALHELMARCDIGVVPMRDDSFVGVPNKMCEYAAAGLRIVSSLGGESAELLRRYGCGDGFAEAVRQVAALPSEAALELARNEFDAVRIYDGYVAACARMMAFAV